MNDNILKLSPIGHLYCDEKYNYDTPRQSVLADNKGVIKLNPNCNYEQALADLEGFERIWVLYLFHRNSGWKPKVSPPRTPENKKIGLFATRSPHRPNSIGLSCVILENVVGLNVYIRNFDLLDETPILDIKPYIPYCDSFPESKTGWLEKLNSDEYLIESTGLAKKQILWIKSNTGLDLQKFIKIHLSVEPLNNKRKRVFKLDKNSYIYAYRTWRVHFFIDESSKAIRLLKISSGYTSDDLCKINQDKYGDKEYHRNFILEFESIC